MSTHTTPGLADGAEGANGGPMGRPSRAGRFIVNLCYKSHPVEFCC